MPAIRREYRRCHTEWRVNHRRKEQNPDQTGSRVRTFVTRKEIGKISRDIAEKIPLVWTESKTYTWYHALDYQM